MQRRSTEVFRSKSSTHLPDAGLLRDLLDADRDQRDSEVEAWELDLHRTLAKLDVCCPVRKCGADVKLNVHLGDEMGSSIGSRLQVVN